MHYGEKVPTRDDLKCQGQTPPSVPQDLYTSLSTPTPPSVPLHLPRYLRASTPPPLPLHLYTFRYTSTPPSVPQDLYTSLSTSTPLHLPLHLYTPTSQNRLRDTCNGVVQAMRWGTPSQLFPELNIVQEKDCFLEPGMEVGPFFVAPGLAKLPAQKASLPGGCGLRSKHPRSPWHTRLDTHLLITRPSALTVPRPSLGICVLISL